MEFNIQKVLQDLFKDRPIFHSEADFQFALAWKIKEFYSGAKIRLEMRSDNFDKKEYIDILVELDNKKYPIELKYKTKGLNMEWETEKFNLSNHGAQDIGRYDFIKDVVRIENFIKDDSIGYAILLTNDSYYWKATPRAEKAGYAQFRLDEKREELKGFLDWGDNISEGTKKGREDVLKLKHKYNLKWEDIKNKEIKDLFRYLLLEIKN